MRGEGGERGERRSMLCTDCTRESRGNLRLPLDEMRREGTERDKDRSGRGREIDILQLFLLKGMERRFSTLLLLLLDRRRVHLPCHPECGGILVA